MFLSYKKNLKKNAALLIIKPDVVWIQASILCLFTTGVITIITCGTPVKPVLRDHSKIGKTKVIKTNGSLIKVESIARLSSVPSFS